MSKMLECRSVVMNKFMSAIDVNEPNPDVAEKIQKVLQNLRSLRLDFIYYGEKDLKPATYIAETHRFFSAVPSFWLKPAHQTLKELNLAHCHFWGYYLKLDLRGVHFSRLRILQLTKYTLVHDSQLDGIFSHRDTLAELYLEDCAIGWDIEATADKEMAYLDPNSYITRPGSGGKRYATYDKRWHDYFKSFQELRHLQRFRYGWIEKYGPFEEGPDLNLSMHIASYMLYGSLGYQELPSYCMDTGNSLKYGAEWVIEDETSLEELYAKIGYKYVVGKSQVRRG
ncbi:hypothetical protein ABOM_003050 [Aspergillus bombycis]|uniref:F-box domain protein n=1 Tax=Aspergillus bombycis TaxID=109264 RepID=A0A1F8AAM7_9EURO|nr:hypothetical protein ABOM_003050 [Aspergillus bombycis]OGM48784.1 hypothetical protein ABOM_003050 [Aspergillus bombycis]